jgi:hypothetical protein
VDVVSGTFDHDVLGAGHQSHQLLLHRQRHFGQLRLALRAEDGRQTASA